MQEQVQISAAAETLMVLGHIAAELMAGHMASEPAEQLIARQMAEWRID